MYDRVNIVCPRCSGRLYYSAEDLAMVCMNCGRNFYVFMPRALIEVRKRPREPRLSDGDLENG